MSIEITILIPVWNNEKEVQNAYRRIREVVLTLERSIEILFVDDGSEDATFAILQEIRRSDPRVSILKLSRNHGQHPATDLRTSEKAKWLRPLTTCRRLGVFSSRLA